VGSVSRYSYINARLHALISTLLTEDFFIRMERTPSVDESLYFFQSTPYSFMPGIYARTGDLKSVEKSLTTYLFNEIRHLRRHAPTELHPLIAVLSGRIRYDAFKSSLRLWYDQSFRKRSIDDYTEYIPREIPLEGVSADAIINAPDQEALAALLRGTPYAVVLPGLEKLQESRTLLVSELALEEDYYRRLVDAAESFRGEERMRIKRLIAGEIDEVNLGRLMRMAPHLHDERLIESLHIAGGKRITASDFTHFTRSSDKSLFYDELLHRFGISAPLGKMEKSLEYTKILSNVSRSLDDEKKQLCVKTKVSSLFDAGLAVAYVRLREREIRRITHLLNAQYYGKVNAGGQV